MEIYTTNLDLSDQSTRNILFVEAEAKCALLEDCTHLCDVNGNVYSISTEDGEITLEEVDFDTEDEFYEDEPEYPSESTECLVCDSLFTIDKIINNSLKSTEPITPQQADTMLKLAALRKALLGH